MEPLFTNTPISSLISRGMITDWVPPFGPVSIIVLQAAVADDGRRRKASLQHPFSFDQKFRLNLHNGVAGDGKGELVDAGTCCCENSGFWVVSWVFIHEDAGEWYGFVFSHA